MRKAVLLSSADNVDFSVFAAIPDSLGESCTQTRGSLQQLCKSPVQNLFVETSSGFSLQELGWEYYLNDLEQPVFFGLCLRCCSVAPLR